MKVLRPKAVVAMRSYCCLSLSVALLVSLGSHVVLAQGPGPQVPGGGFDSGDFRMSSEARSSLRSLWRTSTDARAERVACIGGHQSDRVTFITKVQEVTLGSADSLNASAAASLQQCRPPEWLGTVHTHIVQFGGRPYVTFSGADRGVMREWHKIWRADGVFCVLYDDQHGYCEAGDDVSGEVIYSQPRGNSLGQ